MLEAHRGLEEYGGGVRPGIAIYLLAAVPDITIATDVICGFPGESEEDWAKTMALCRKYAFREVHISQFYPRPGTPAARMKRVDTKEVKRRSRESSPSTSSPTRRTRTCCNTTQRVWVTDVAKDGVSLVGHTKAYEQVLLLRPEQETASQSRTASRSAKSASSVPAAAAEIGGGGDAHVLEHGLDRLKKAAHRGLTTGNSLRSNTMTRNTSSTTLRLIDGIGVLSARRSRSPGL